MESALRERPAPFELHHKLGHDHDFFAPRNRRQIFASFNTASPRSGHSGGTKFKLSTDRNLAERVTTRRPRTSQVGGQRTSPLGAVSARSGGGIDKPKSVRGFSKGKTRDKNPFDHHGGYARDCEPACKLGGGLHGRLRPNDRCLFFGE
jgi:hypothetical protein